MRRLSDEQRAAWLSRGERDVPTTHQAAAIEAFEKNPDGRPGVAGLTVDACVKRGWLREESTPVTYKAEHWATGELYDKVCGRVCSYHVTDAGKAALGRYRAWVQARFPVLFRAEAG